MGKVKYDIAKLKVANEIDADGALEAAADEAEYYGKLGEFLAGYNDYLTRDSEYKIVTRDESRLRFLRELKALRELFTACGFVDAMLDIKYLEKAAMGKDAETLKHELTEFRLRLIKISRIIENAQFEVPDEPEITAVSSKTEKAVIMAVDDMPGLLSATVQMLKDKYSVVALTSAKAALKALEKQTPSLFLLDIEMPGMNGYDLAKEIRAIDRFAQTPILFLTSHSSRDDVILAIMHGGNDFIVKPVDKEMLLGKLERFLSGV